MMIDLSRNGNETANSYIIQKPGNYCFPLVYGNALLNNKPNEKSYTKLGGDKQADFYDYRNNIITRPEIPDKIYETKILVWDSSREFISDLRTENDYIKFQITYVPDDGANYILGVLDWSGKVVWSWHLWLWKSELKDQDLGNGYKVLNINLGTKGNRVMYYQWGRKDPFNPLLTHRYKSTYKLAVTIGEAIQSPWMFFHGQSYEYNNNWVALKNYNNYWNSWCNDYQRNEKVEKTIYDPCPPGYNVPRRDILNKVNIKILPGAEITIKDKEDIIFPKYDLIGINGEIYKWKDDNYYWTAGNYEKDSANMFSAERDRFLYCNGYIRIMGLPIRPQKREE